MNDQTDQTDLNDARGEITSLSLPIQAAPVYRTSAGGKRTGSGVEPSDWLEDLVRGAGSIISRW